MTGQERPGFQQQLLAQESELTLLCGEGNAVSRSRICHFFSGSASGHIYTAEHSSAQGFWSCLWAVVVLVSQQEYSACLEYYSNIPTVFAPLSLPLRWLDECKVSPHCPSVELHSAVCSPLFLEVLKKLIIIFMNDFISILICGFWSVGSYLF